jgi:hypothetical protein
MVCAGTSGLWLLIRSVALRPAQNSMGLAQAEQETARPVSGLVAALTAFGKFWFV